VHDLEDSVGKAAADEEVRHRLGTRGGVGCGLPHHGVAAQEGRDEVPGGNRDGEVARGDDHRRAHRLAEGEQLLVGKFRRDGLPVQPAALAQEEPAGVDDLLDLAA
jgi:hypothetical protein